MEDILSFFITDLPEITGRVKTECVLFSVLAISYLSLFRNIKLLSLILCALRELCGENFLVRESIDVF